MVKSLLKLFTIGLLLFLTINISADDRSVQNYPTDQQIKDLWNADSQLVMKMVRKLYWIEKAPLKINSPQYTATLMNNGDLILIPKYDNGEFDTVQVGDGLLQYQVKYSTIKFDNFHKDNCDYLTAILYTASITTLVCGVIFVAISMNVK